MRKIECFILCKSDQRIALRFSLSLHFCSIDCSFRIESYDCQSSSAIECFRFSLNFTRATQKNGRNTTKKNECSIFPWESLFSLKRKNIIGSLYRAALARYMARCTDQRQFVHTKKECVCAPIQKQQQHSLMCVFCTFIARSLRRLDRQLM